MTKESATASEVAEVAEEPAGRDGPRGDRDRRRYASGDGDGEPRRRDRQEADFEGDRLDGARDGDGGGWDGGDRDGDRRQRESSHTDFLRRPSGSHISE